ncbi:hypothetical protein [Streptacidiphilus rugosus]|uniref:hypothetical protein n=1 Tax=Streptacidiphilus rugosus TaxID=405783 RepID=UPI00056CA999|nr:hypothetical protein [Streptacidiphilus rugosus]
MRSATPSPSRPLLEVGWLHGLLGWLYVAAVAAVRPDTMSLPITAVVPLRRDTFGACCFVVSALAALVLQARGQAHRPGRLTPGTTAAVLRTIVCYALLVWVYVCVNSLTHPGTIGRRLTHFSPTPAEGTTAVLCFAVSAVALLLLRLLRARQAPPEPAHG